MKNIIFILALIAIAQISCLKANLRDNASTQSHGNGFSSAQHVDSHNTLTSQSADNKHPASYSKLQTKGVGLDVFMMTMFKW
jgi:hypothetical protein